MTDPGWARTDAGPLLCPDGRAGSLVLLAPRVGRYPEPPPHRLADHAPGIALEAEMPYPRAAPGPFTGAAWLSSVAPPGSLDRVRPCLPAFSTALLVLAPVAMLLRPTSPLATLAVCLLLTAGALLDHAARIGSLSGRRTASLAISGRLWDRVLDQRPGAMTSAPRRWARVLRTALTAALDAEPARAALSSLLVRLGIGAALVLTSGQATAIAGAATCCVVGGVAARAAALREALAVHALAARREALAEQGASLVRDLAWLRPLGGEGFALARRQRASDAEARAAATVERAALASAAIRWAASILPPVAVLVLSGWRNPVDRDAVLLALFGSGLLGLAAAELGRARGTGRVRRARIGRVDHRLDLVESAGPDAGSIETVAAQDLGFAFGPGQRPLFGGVDLAVGRGEVVAISGVSGAGKSTLLRLLVGLLEPTTGAVTVNGRPLSAMDRRSYRRRIGAVFQAGPVGFGTVRSMIGGSILSLPEVEAAARLAGLADDIAALPMGYQTLVIEGAFPAGLVARLAIARAVAGRPDFVILDEALSPLEPERAAAILCGLRDRGIAVVICSHLPEILRLADRVVPLGAPVPVAVGRADGAAGRDARPGLLPAPVAGRSRPAAPSLFRPAALARLRCPNQLDAPIPIPSSFRTTAPAGLALAAIAALLWWSA